MRETSNKSSSSEQQSNINRDIFVAMAVCGAWFVLASVSAIPGLLFHVDPASQLGQGISHAVRLMGGLLLVFGLLPAFLRAYYKPYKTYLRATGVLFPADGHHRIVLTAFIVVASFLLTIELAQDGLAGLEEYHAANGMQTLELAAFASLQAALIEELIFRGIAFDILRRRFPVWVAILLPAIFFGFAHVWWGLGRVAVTAIVGALFALLRWRTNNLWGPIAMHFLINLGFPMPAWLGWLLALLLGAGLEIGKHLRRKSHDEAG